MVLPASRQVADYGRTLLTLPAVKGGRTYWESGDIAARLGMACVLSFLGNKSAGDVVTGLYEGEFEINCASGVTASEGADAFYDEANRTVVTAGGSGIIYLGTFAKDKTSGQTVATVMLRGSSARFGTRVQCETREFTAAQVNAGAILLPKIAGYKYRVRDIKIVAQGGNAASVTTVDILGTQSSSSVKLLAAAVAGLTQSAIGRLGTTNFAALADGASLKPCDVETDITIGKTGSNVTGATGFLITIDYDIIK